MTALCTDLLCVRPWKLLLVVNFITSVVITWNGEEKRRRNSFDGFLLSQIRLEFCSHKGPDITPERNHCSGWSSASKWKQTSWEWKDVKLSEMKACWNSSLHYICAAWGEAGGLPSPTDRMDTAFWKPTQNQEAAVSLSQTHRKKKNHVECDSILLVCTAPSYHTDSVSVSFNAALLNAYNVLCLYWYHTARNIHPKCRHVIYSI